MDPSNPGDPVKALSIYEFLMVLHSVPVCEYGYLLLTGRGGVYRPKEGLRCLEGTTQLLLEDMPSHMKEDVLAYTTLLMKIYNEGLFGVPSDSKKGEMYMEHRKRIGGTKEISPEYEEKIRYNNFILDTIDSMKGLS